MTRETKEAFDARFAREMTEAAEGMRRVGMIDAFLPAISA